MATLTFKGLTKTGKIALYTGLRTTTRLSITDFPNSQPPQTLEINGDLAEPRVARVTMTAEERKAARINRVKPTVAEQLAKLEARTAKIRAKLAAQAA